MIRRNAVERDICCPTTSPHCLALSSCLGQGRKLAFSHCHCVPDRSSILAQLILITSQDGYHFTLCKRKRKTKRRFESAQETERGRTSIQAWRLSSNTHVPFMVHGSFHWPSHDITGNIWLIFNQCQTQQEETEQNLEAGGS